jgi:hypothetical protein
MTNWSMRRKLYLYPALLRELPELDDQIRMERDKVLAAYGVSSPMLTGMPGSSGPGDPCGNTVVNQVLPGWERYDALCQRRQVKQSIVMEVEQYLDSLDALELSVVKLRYFSRFSWPEICDAEYISEATAHRVHDAARRKYKSESF